MFRSFAHPVFVFPIRALLQVPLSYIVIVIIQPLLLVVLGLLFFSSSGHDDSHITYWPASTLASRGEIINYNGDRVEQSSSLLHVLLLGVASHLTGIALPTLGPLSSILGGILCVVLAVRLAGTLDHRASIPAALLVATYPPLVYWAFAGLETTLAAACALWLLLEYGVVLDEQPGWITRLRASLATLVWLLVRPESAFVLMVMLGGALCVVLLHRHSTPIRAIAKLLVFAVVLAALIAAWRVWYFGTLVPQPVVAKGGLRLADGAVYLARNMLQFNGLALLLGLTGAIVVLLDHRQRLDLWRLLSSLFVLASIGFIVASGGDWMWGGRFLAHVAPVVLVIAAVALLRLVQGTQFVYIVTGLVLLQLVSFIPFARTQSSGLPLWQTLSMHLTPTASDFSWFETANRVHARDITTIPALDRVITDVQQRIDRPVVVLSGQMGMILFHIAGRHPDQVKVHDRYGLADRTYASCSLTGRSSRRALGMNLSYALLLGQANELQQVCGIAQPDIIFDLTDGDRAIVESFGYVVVYAQKSTLVDSSWLASKPVQASQWIAVRKGLAIAVSSPNTR